MRNHKQWNELEQCRAEWVEEKNIKKKCSMYQSICTLEQKIANEILIDTNVLFVTCYGSRNRLLLNSNIKVSHLIIDESTLNTVTTSLIPINLLGLNRSTNLNLSINITNSNTTNNQNKELELNDEKEEKQKQKQKQQQQQYNDNKHLILIGDPKQLFPIVESDEAKKAKFDQSLFEKFYQSIQFGLLIKSNHFYQFLNIQYRMHPIIAAFSNKQFYNNKLLNGSNTKKYNSTYNGYCHKLLSLPFCWINVKYTTTTTKVINNINQTEANIVINIIKYIIDSKLILIIVIININIIHWEI